MDPVRLRVPGRICLFGDKIDIAHKPVIAAAIDMLMEITATATDGPEVALYSHDLCCTERFEIGDEPDLRGHMKYVQAAVSLLRDRLPPAERAGFCMEVKTEIPIGAGLSTSAALTVGAIMALDELFELGMRREEIAETAYEAEHDICAISCGRMDQYAIAYGGITFISTGEPPSAEVLPIEELPVVVGDSDEPRHAAEVLNRTRERLEAGDEVVIDAFEKLHQYTLAGREALLAGDAERVGELMTRSQAQERRIDASTPKIERLCAASVEAGARGAKQMGAGGGGCIVAFCPDRQHEVAAAIEAEGGIPYICDIFRWSDEPER